MEEFIKQKLNHANECLREILGEHIVSERYVNLVKQKLNNYYYETKEDLIECIKDIIRELGIVWLLPDLMNIVKQVNPDFVPVVSDKQRKIMIHLVKNYAIVHWNTYGSKKPFINMTACLQLISYDLASKSKEYTSLDPILCIKSTERLHMTVAMYQMYKSKCIEDCNPIFKSNL
jgi:hypothetical protein